MCHAADTFPQQPCPLSSSQPRWAGGVSLSHFALWSSTTTPGLPALLHTRRELTDMQVKGLSYFPNNPSDQTVASLELRVPVLTKVLTSSRVPHLGLHFLKS